MPLVRRRLSHKQSVPHRRVTGKQPPFLWRDGPIRSGYLAGLDALRHESAAGDGLLPLPLDFKRRHIHYTHVRTNSATDVQPSQLTREAFWDHLMKCYQEAYPRADSETGSILEFGIVSKEKHKDARLDVDRSEHHHAAIYSSMSHYWRRVRKISAEKYRIHLNAVAHETYTTMYNYLRKATAKKPLYELDPTPFHSPRHPQGDLLRELLQRGERYRQVRSGKAPASGNIQVRSQFGIAYKWVVDHGLRKRAGAVQLEMDAVQELKAGRPQLLEFVKKFRATLEDELEFCWSLHEAPKRLARMAKTRLELLLEAALPEQQCQNDHGACAVVYDSILTHQGRDIPEFCHDIFDVLDKGRCKGGALMVVGGKDTGKTTVTEPARLIYQTMKTPQSDSFCPLQDLRGHELLLWQDFRYNPGHPRRDEQGLRIDEGTWNRLLEGLPTLIGVPKTDASRSDFVYDGDAAMIFTGPFELLAYRNGRVDDIETQQLSCRMRYVHFNKPTIGRAGQPLKHCPTCWSRWVLRGEMQWRRLGNHAIDEFMANASATIGEQQPCMMPGSSTGAAPIPKPSLMADLARAVEWRQQGLLSEKEFQAAKSALGLC